MAVLAWSSAIAIALPTPTPEPRRLRLNTPTPERQIRSPSVTAGAPTPAATASPTPLPSTVSIKVDATQRFQEIDGFGATHLSLVYDGGPGDVLAPELRRQAIDAVYGQVGIRLGSLEGALLESPGGYDQRSNDDGDATNINWEGFQTAAADAMRTALLDAAVPLGFTGFFPAQKINLRWASPWLVELRSSDYQRYLQEAAEQVEAGMRYWSGDDARVDGISPKLLQLFNEPLSGNGELDNGSTQEVVDLVKAAAERLRRHGLGDVRFVVPNEESVPMSIDTTRALLADPLARTAIGAIGYHPYPYGSTYASIPRILATSGQGKPDVTAVDERTQLAALAQSAHLPLWMTEVSHGEVDPLSFDDLRGRAIHIHDELTYAGASAYFGMNNMWDSESQRMHFGSTGLFDPANEGNIVLVDSDAGKVYITGMGYAIGHYARWLRPGAVRLGSTSSDPLVLVTAFENSGGGQRGKLVLVIINNAAVSKSLQIGITGANLDSSLRGEQSTRAAAWQPLAEAVANAENQVRVVVPAYSVTTLATAP